ncbi:YbaB/EbfC family nucleoid-associated protein [Kutzneria sp. CA-103260]|uniref:YbaB/EbfC family nucleoid-associated protein n=1 Tax=Kutzneria sp. CA-103260 TaxID=2802641 RepID=UPI001BA5DB06|nr:YbaB/EbfC family nucleoid-associated protein [Kutzneria sp. CA-103260]QUQ67167.1 Nucleoid-associated protein YbaB [Kutzneria sp. CA-103260]
MDIPLQLDMHAEYERMAADVRSLRVRLGEIRVGAESDDGLITAVAGGTGQLLELRLDPRIYRAPDSAALARTITDTINLAARRAQQEGEAIAASFLSDDTESADPVFDPLLTALDRVVNHDR